MKSKSEKNGHAVNVSLGFKQCYERCICPKCDKEMSKEWFKEYDKQLSHLDRGLAQYFAHGLNAYECCVCPLCDSKGLQSPMRIVKVGWCYYWKCYECSSIGNSLYLMAYAQDREEKRNARYF